MEKKVASFEKRTRSLLELISQLFSEMDTDRLITKVMRARVGGGGGAGAVMGVIYFGVHLNRMMVVIGVLFHRIMDTANKTTLS